MKYRDFIEILKSKNIMVKDVLSFIQMTRPGLNSALDNDTLELRKIKLLCDYLRISPAMFFESGTFGVIQKNTTAENKECDSMKREIELLKARLKDKDDIISLLREKGAGYGIAAEPKNY